MKENNSTQAANPGDSPTKPKEQDTKDKTVSGHTEVKNAHASGLGSMGRHDEDENGTGKTEKD
ncbi:MAG: hypothetical protein ACJ75F_07935 [Flavisolibacter sp.]|jgi:hypothetical protein